MLSHTSLPLMISSLRVLNPFRCSNSFFFFFFKKKKETFLKIVSQRGAEQSTLMDFIELCEKLRLITLLRSWWAREKLERLLNRLFDKSIVSTFVVVVVVSKNSFFFSNLNAFG